LHYFKLRHYPILCGARFCDSDRARLRSRWLSWQLRSLKLLKEHLWEFLGRQRFRRGPVEIYGEMELLRLLDRFFDRRLCLATEGYEQHSQLQD
jgi:hypothetical protein